MEFKVNKASAQEKNMDVGANIFVGNLDPEVDEKLLYDTFSAFGVILQVKSNMCYYFPDDFIESYILSDSLSFRYYNFRFRYPKSCAIRIRAPAKASHSSTSPPSKRPTWPWKP